MDSNVSALFAPTSYPAAFSELGALLGPRWVSTRGIDRLAYSHDAWSMALKWVQQARYPYVPEIIAWPGTAQEVAIVIDVARRHGLSIVPYGGGSGCVGGILPLRKSIMVDLKRMDQITAIDRVAQWATVGAGMIVQDTEEQLNLAGFTLGHFPQSMHSASIGGCVAHNGIGTFSTKYGKFDDMVLGMQVVMPNCEVVDIKAVPKSSTGPNLSQLFLGSEGTLGIVTRTTLKIHEVPEVRLYQAYAVPTVRLGLDIMRRVVQHDLRPPVVRLYDEVESASLYQRLGRDAGQSLILLCFEGYSELAEAEARIGAEICTSMGVEALGPELGESWFAKGRFNVSAYITQLRKPAGVFDALEVSATWDRLADLYYEIREAMAKYSVGVMGHSSHVYPQGGNLYMIFFADAESADPEKLEQLYVQVLDAAFQVCGRLGASISHHHGIGLAKAQWMSLEHGQAGMNVLRAIKRALDADDVMNPGKMGLGV